MIQFSVMLDSLKDQARRALRETRNEDAQAILINIIVSEPRDDEAWLLLAEALAENSKKQECLERARAINPRNPAILRALEQLVNAEALDASPAEQGGNGKATDETSNGDTKIPAVLLDQGKMIAQTVMMTTEPPDTRSAGLELIQVLDQASQHDTVQVQRWAVTAGRDALVKYEKALSSMIANLPRADPQLAALRDQRQRLLQYLK